MKMTTFHVRHESVKIFTPAILKIANSHARAFCAVWQRLEEQLKK
jgi:hypothetical protein